MDVRPVAAGELGMWATWEGQRDAALEIAVRGLWDRGSSRPEWTLVADRDREQAGRVAIAVDPIAGGLPTPEYRLVGLAVDWAAADAADVCRALADAAIAASEPEAGATVDVRLNAEVHDRIPERRRVIEAAGFELFQEKASYTWQEDGAEIASPARLRLTPLAEARAADLKRVMGRCMAGTLDRNDRYYWGVCGPEVWADEMSSYVTPADAATWFLAHNALGTQVGFVLLSAFDEPGGATIVHIGVLPEARGNGYVHELLAGATIAARRRGFGHILSDVDTDNAPMRSAMETAGHLPGRRRWHVWHYRRIVGSNR